MSSMEDRDLDLGLDEDLDNDSDWYGRALVLEELSDPRDTSTRLRATKRTAA